MESHTDRLTLLSRAFSLIGLEISTYLFYTYLAAKAPVCFVGPHGSGCGKVEHSTYAWPLGPTRKENDEI